MDIPSVEWVVQWEPPLSPAALVHRAGRAGRAGARGCSLLPLLPTEEAYVPFVRTNQMVQLQDWRQSEDDIKITQKLRDKVGFKLKYLCCFMFKWRPRYGEADENPAKILYITYLHVLLVLSRDVRI